MKYFLALLLVTTQIYGAIPELELEPVKKIDLGNFKPLKISKAEKASPFIDVPITYNKEVQTWVKYFQGKGRKWFRRWLERSYKYLPEIQRKLTNEGLPKDLAYIAMIESGFSSKAVSVASAVGPWQFIKPTGLRFGLKIEPWIDERRDFTKSTAAAIKYMQVLYKEFNSWYLVAAAYNTGEGRVRRYIKRYKTKDFWTLSKKRAFVEETRNYIPKFLAAVLISKAPQLYGFKNLNPQFPLNTEYYFVPGGTDLKVLAKKLKITERSLMDMNPELLQGRIPRSISGHLIKVPKGATSFLSRKVAQSN